jgi:hypothetical protein
VPTSWLQIANAAESTVAVARDAGASTLVVVDGAPFGASFPMALAIARSGALVSILKATARTDATFTIDGTLDGTTDADLLLGDRVLCAPVASNVTQLQEAADALETALDGKAASVHTHAIADTTGLQTALDAKALDSGVVHLAGTETITGLKTFTATVQPTSAVKFVNPDTSSPRVTWSSTWNAGAEASMGLRFFRDTVEIARFQDNGYCLFKSIGTLGNLNITDTRIGRSTTGARLTFSDSTGVAAVAISTDNATAHDSALLASANIASTVALVAQGATGQTANIAEFRGSTGTVLSAVDKSGHMVIPAGDGAPATTPASGALYLDATNSRLYVRVGSTWKYATLT